MNKRERMENYYKNKSKEDKIEQYYKEKIKEARNTKFKENQINQYYKDKLKNKKIIYAYKKLAEVRPVYRVLNSLSVRINKEMKKAGIKREFTYTQILGCSINEFEIYLENKFTEGMSFENYGEWEIDHIRPVSVFDFNNLDDIKKCCHYTNLQPLPKPANRQKYNKIICV